MSWPLWVIGLRPPLQPRSNKMQLAEETIPVFVEAIHLWMGLVVAATGEQLDKNEKET